MTRTRAAVLAALVLSASLWAHGCSGGTDEPVAPPPPDPPRPTTVRVTPATTRLMAVGANVQLSAQVNDQNGRAIGDAAVSWSSSDSSVATVDATSGMVTAIGQGAVRIGATAGSASGHATVTVAVDGAALVTLYDATGGADWTDRAGWLTDAPLGEWFGVGTDNTGRVTELAISANNLTGPVPPELGELTNLTRLDLHANGLSGSIPAELGDLVNLKILSLHTNSLSGAIPQSFLDLAQLRNLVLGNTSVCVPGTAAFTLWLAKLEYHDTDQLDVCITG